MFQELWLTNIYLLAFSIATIGFSAYSWIYLSSYFVRKDYHLLLKGLGSAIIVSGFVVDIIKSYLQKDITATPGLYISLITVGILLLAIGVYMEPIPGKPKITPKAVVPAPKVTKKRKTTTKRTLSLIFPVLPGLIGMAVIIYHTYRKINYGLSKEFTPLLVGWITFFTFLVLEYINIYFLPLKLMWLENPDGFALYDMLKYILLFITAVAIFVWLNRFISFKPVPRMFFSLWQLLIIGSLLLNSVFAVLTIRSTEEQIYGLLEKNASLVTFTLDQIRKNNSDLLTVLSQNSDFVTALKNKNEGAIQNIVDKTLVNNLNLDKMIVTDSQAILIFDSQSPTSVGSSISSNQVIKKAILDAAPAYGYVPQETQTGGYTLAFYYAYPIFVNEKDFVGVVTSVKNIDDTYLDILKNQTGQELVLYVRDLRAATTLVDSDSISRYENISLQSTSIFQTAKRANISVAQLALLTKPYFMAIVDLPTFADSSQTNKLMVGTEQTALLTSTESVLFSSFLAVFVFCLIATIPTYLLAKDMDKDLSA